MVAAVCTLFSGSILLNPMKHITYATHVLHLDCIVNGARVCIRLASTVLGKKKRKQKQSRNVSWFHLLFLTLRCYMGCIQYEQNTGLRFGKSKKCEHQALYYSWLPHDTIHQLCIVVLKKMCTYFV